MSTQHTPGEWAAVKDPCPTTNNRWLIEKRGNGWKTLIAEVYGDADHQGGKDWQGTREGNAKLIAAAPKLLTALEVLVAEGECYCADGVAAKGPCGHCEARAAIAKAKV